MFVFWLISNQYPMPISLSGKPYLKHHCALGRAVVFPCFPSLCVIFCLPGLAVSLGRIVYMISDTCCLDHLPLVHLIAFSLSMHVFKPRLIA